jgi:hypothetical protein
VHSNHSIEEKSGIQGDGQKVMERTRRLALVCRAHFTLTCTTPLAQIGFEPTASSDEKKRKDSQNASTKAREQLSRSQFRR